MDEADDVSTKQLEGLRAEVLKLWNHHAIGEVQPQLARLLDELETMSRRLHGETSPAALADISWAGRHSHNAFKARPFFELAYAGWVKAEGHGEPNTLAAAAELARCLRLVERRAEALALIEGEVQLHRAAHPGAADDRLGAIIAWAEVLYTPEIDDMAEALTMAEPAMEAAIDTIERRGDQPTDDLLACQHRLAKLWVDAVDHVMFDKISPDPYDRGLSRVGRSLADHEEVLGWKHERTIHARSLLIEIERLGASAPLLDRLRVNVKAAQAGNDDELARQTIIGLFEALMEIGNYAEAYETSADVFEDVDDLGTSVAAAHLALDATKALLALGRSDEALELAQRVLDDCRRSGLEGMVSRAEHVLNWLRLQQSKYQQL